MDIYARSKLIQIRTDWTREEVADLFDLPFMELMWRAQTVHREHHAAGEVQLFAVRFHDEMLRRCALRRVPEGPGPTRTSNTRVISAAAAGAIASAANKSPRILARTRLIRAVSPQNG